MKRKIILLTGAALLALSIPAFAMTPTLQGTKSGNLVSGMGQTTANQTADWCEVSVSFTDYSNNHHWMGDRVDQLSPYEGGRALTATFRFNGYNCAQSVKGLYSEHYANEGITDEQEWLHSGTFDSNGNLSLSY